MIVAHLQRKIITHFIQTVYFALRKKCNYIYNATNYGSLWVASWGLLYCSCFFKIRSISKCAMPWLVIGIVFLLMMVKDKRYRDSSLGVLKAFMQKWRVWPNRAIGAFTKITHYSLLTPCFCSPLRSFSLWQNYFFSVVLVSVSFTFHHLLWCCKLSLLQHCC